MPGNVHEFDQWRAFEGADIVCFNIGLGTTCNFSCVYCPEELHDGSTPWVDSKKLLHLCKVLSKKYAFKKKRIFNFLGGEPSYMPGLLDVMSEIKGGDDQAIIRLATNGSRGASWWKKASPFLDTVIVSLHVAQIDIEKLNENFKVCIENGVVLTTNVLMDINHWEKSVKISEFLVEKGWSYLIELKPVETMLGSNELQNYSPEQRKFLQNWDKSHSRLEASINLRKGNGNRKLKMEYGFYSSSTDTWRKQSNFRTVSKDEDTFYNWYCWIGADKLAILDTGVVRGGDTCQLGKVFGNYLDTNPEDWDWSFDHVVCKNKRCVCGGDLEAVKFKNIKHSDAYRQHLIDELKKENYGKFSNQSSAPFKG